MKWTGLNELREKYLSFFESKGHLRHKSFPLVPINDKSILLINAGMTPLKKYFTGELEPPRHRMTTCQKCIRTPDIDRVGITARHGTFFEMLGNFSFGDYFKREAISWAWEFITEVLELPKDRLWVTIYLDDDEAYDIWANEVGVNPAHIVRLGKEDNFWEHGSGPCGPCSEIHFDRGPEYGCGSPDCKPGCDCDRFMEFWNLVFTQFDNDGHNNYTRLAKPNIDTGMGLERLACLMQGVNNLFEVDTVRNIMNAIENVSGVKYGDNEKNDISLRVITDHIRSSSFLICDGVVPSNEGRGYVLRRLLRRAARHGRMLGISGTVLADICTVVAKENYSEYPELTEKLAYIQKVISMEEERFAATIDAGLSILSNIIRKATEDGLKNLTGEDVFRLYDTYGFPFDLTKEIAQEQNLGIDEEEFKNLMKVQKERARAARANISGWSDASKNLISEFSATEFVGYALDKCDATVLGIVSDDALVDEITEGEFTLITDKTVFYGEGGGQVGDTGVIYDNDTMINVTDTKKVDGVYLHICTLVSGSVKVGDAIALEINRSRRESIKRNHSACHLLQAALRQVLGNHVEQAGSYVDETRVRFDFSHFAALTEKELKEVEALVNYHILVADEISTLETDIETAKKNGAMALFGEKYGDKVRMVKMGNFSTELCGGTHMDNTGKLGLFKIISESSVAAGVRRIEGTTGLGVLALIAEKDNLIGETAKELKVGNPLDLPKKVAQLQNELKGAKSEIESLNSKLAAGQTDAIKAGMKTVNGINLIVHTLKDAASDMPRSICDELKASDDNVVAVIALVNGDKLTFSACCGKNAVAKGAHAGMILKNVSAICNGGGGGRPDSASSGGKDISKLNEALEAVESILLSLLK
ncbi:MAG: alanine--tRNA ligase [Clostridia bacterium]|nr:alanine--tRNA ligase [Clostridia bacterium]